MYTKKDIYTLETILGMLDIALTELAENECCTHCSNKDPVNTDACNDMDLCKSCLFEGILEKLKRSQKTDETERGARKDTEISARKPHQY